MKILVSGFDPFGGEKSTLLLNQLSYCQIQLKEMK